MALVDYASDDDDDDDGPSVVAPAPAAHPLPAPMALTSPRDVPVAQRGAGTSLPVRLPDAVELLGGSSPMEVDSGGVEAKKKRPLLNGSADPSHLTKVPRGNSSSARASSLSGTFVPPQLRGRSNVATEDLDKLFVQRQQRRSE